MVRIGLPEDPAPGSSPAFSGIVRKRHPELSDRTAALPPLSNLARQGGPRDHPSTRRPADATWSRDSPIFATRLLYASPACLARQFRRFAARETCRAMSSSTMQGSVDERRAALSRTSRRGTATGLQQYRDARAGRSGERRPGLAMLTPYCLPGRQAGAGARRRSVSNDAWLPLHRSTLPRLRRLRVTWDFCDGWQRTTRRCSGRPGMNA